MDEFDLMRLVIETDFYEMNNKFNAIELLMWAKKIGFTK